MSVKIYSISNKSIFKKYNIQKNDIIISINNRELNNFEGLIYELENDVLLIRIKKQNGIIVEKVINREDFDKIKIQFKEEPIKHCNNKCIFCFIDQNPKGLRKSIYFKDDDYRLSIEYGNFITLNNINQRHIDDIIQHKFSPLYISLHAITPHIREKLFGRKSNAISILKQLLKNNIKIHGQIVLVRGLNDNGELIKTMRFACKYKFLSLGIVPTGLTKFRDKLKYIKPIDRDYSKHIIDTVENFKIKNGVKNIYLADEFFINANYDIPNIRYYNKFEQIENGIGMTRQFLEQTKTFNKNALKSNYAILTGKLFGSYLRNNNYFNSMIHIAYNNFYGESINVAGLLSGSDIIRAAEKINDKNILISGEIFNNQGLTIDNMNIKFIKEKTGKNIIPIFNYNELEKYICQ